MYITIYVYIRSSSASTCSPRSSPSSSATAGASPQLDQYEPPQWTRLLSLLQTIASLLQ